MHPRYIALASILSAASSVDADDLVEPAATAPTADPAVSGSEPDGPAPVTETISVHGSTDLDRRSYAHDWLVAPPGWNFSGEMRFITAGSAPSGEHIKLTDMALLRFRTRWTVTKRLELSASADLLAKQLDATREPLAQGGSLGAKLATSKTLAIAAGVAGGPTLGDGWWGSSFLGAVNRSRIEQFIALQIGAGALATVVNAETMTTRQW